MVFELLWFGIAGADSIIAGSSNGRIVASEAIHLGSSPSPAAMAFWKKISPWIKWGLVVWVLVLGVVLYYNLAEVVTHILIIPFQNWLNSIGYVFPISDVLSWILKLLLPAYILPMYVLRLDSDSVGIALSRFLENTTILQLILLATLIPAAVFYQNKWYREYLQ